MVAALVSALALLPAGAHAFLDLDPGRDWDLPVWAVTVLTVVVALALLLVVTCCCCCCCACCRGRGRGGADFSAPQPHTVVVNTPGVAMDAERGADKDREDTRF